MKTLPPLIYSALIACALILPPTATAENQTEAQQLCNDNPEDNGQVTSYLKTPKCRQATPAATAAVAAQDNGPVAICLRSRSQYEGAQESYDVKRLVSNPDNTPLVPTGGWRGAAASQWVQDRRSMGMLDKNALAADLTTLQESEALNQKVARSCEAALQAAYGSNFLTRRSMLKQLGGDEFENNWPSKKVLLGAELRSIQTAIANLKSAAGL